MEQDAVALRGRLSLQGEMVDSQLERAPRIQESDQGRTLNLRSLLSSCLPSPWALSSRLWQF